MHRAVRHPAGHTRLEGKIHNIQKTGYTDEDRRVLQCTGQTR